MYRMRAGKVTFIRLKQWNWVCISLVLNKELRINSIMPLSNGFYQGKTENACCFFSFHFTGSDVVGLLFENGSRFTV